MVLLPGAPQIDQANNCLPHVDGLVGPHGDSTAVSLEFMSSSKLGSAVSVDFPLSSARLGSAVSADLLFLTLTSFAHIFPLFCLQLDCQSSANCFSVEPACASMCYWMKAL